MSAQSVGMYEGLQAENIADGSHLRGLDPSHEGEVRKNVGHHHPRDVSVYSIFDHWPTNETFEYRTYQSVLIVKGLEVLLSCVQSTTGRTKEGH